MRNIKPHMTAQKNFTQKTSMLRPHTFLYIRSILMIVYAIMIVAQWNNKTARLRHMETFSALLAILWGSSDKQDVEPTAELWMI